MTDTAIPIPDDLQAVMAPRVQAAMDAFRRAWAPAVRELGRSAQRWRVRNLMPTLTVRGVLVHGYTAFEET